MASLQYFNPPGVGQKQVRDFHYSQAVRIPGTGLVKCAGQGGWDSQTFEMVENDVEGQIELAFKNVELVLQHAGLKGWENVYLIRSYHVGIERSLEGFVQASRKFCPNHAPLWTCIETPKLGDPKMLIEIEVEAYEDSGK
jgi:enamine deaminase RidA (YjgF/YER057c/UK114 family)